MEEKAHNHFPQSEGKNQSGKVKNEVFEAFSFFLDFHVVKGREVRSRIVISELCFEVSQFFCVDESEGLSPNIIKSNIFCFPTFILIFKTKGPNVSEVNKLSQTVGILLPHFHIFEAAVKGKTDLANGRRLIFFGCINNEVLLGWVFIDLLILYFTGNEVYVWINFPDFINVIVDCVYAFVCPHFSELAFGVVFEVKVLKLQIFV